jgi:SAM-dependent methyltransferase
MMEPGRITSVEDFFMYGMKRSVKLEKMEGEGLVLNLGAGEAKIPNAVNLDLPDWDARDGLLRFEDETVIAIHIHHFLEHIPNTRKILAEAQRVLKPGGCVYITVPWWNCKLAHHDINHINTFALDSWEVMFGCKFYDASQGEEAVEWRFRIAFNMLLAVKEENIAICTQLVKQ